ncbi:hypothetical protein SARU107417_11400 [Salinibacter ruber]
MRRMSAAGSSWSGLRPKRTTREPAPNDRGPVLNGSWAARTRYPASQSADRARGACRWFHSTTNAYRASGFVTPLSGVGAVSTTSVSAPTDSRVLYASRL